MATSHHAVSSALLTRRRLLFTLLTIGLVAIVVLYGGRRAILSRIGSFLIVEDQLAPAELIVVISGEIPEIRYGLDLYQQGYGQKILFIGAHPVELAVVEGEPFEIVELPWDAIATQWAEQSGVPKDAVLTALQTDGGTYERVRGFLDVAGREGLTSLVVVSDPLHSRRIAFISRSLMHRIADDPATGEPLRIQQAPTPASYYHPAYQYDPQRWWQDEHDVRYLMEESIKMVYYWLRYGLMRSS